MIRTIVSGFLLRFSLKRIHWSNNIFYDDYGNSMEFIDEKPDDLRITNIQNWWLSSSYVKQPPVPVPYVPGMSAPLPGCAAYLPTLPPKQVDTGNGEARIELWFSKDIIGCVTLYNDIIWISMSYIQIHSNAINSYISGDYIRT